MARYSMPVLTAFTLARLSSGKVFIKEEHDSGDCAGEPTKVYVYGDVANFITYSGLDGMTPDQCTPQESGGSSMFSSSTCERQLYTSNNCSGNASTSVSYSADEAQCAEDDHTLKWKTTGCVDQAPTGDNVVDVSCLMNTEAESDEECGTACDFSEDEAWTCGSMKKEHTDGCASDCSKKRADYNLADKFGCSCTMDGTDTNVSSNTVTAAASSLALGLVILATVF